MAIAVAWFADTQIKAFDGSGITNVAIFAGKSSVAAGTSTFFNFDRARFTRVVFLGSVQRHEGEPEVYTLLINHGIALKIFFIIFVFNFNLIKYLLVPQISF